MDYLSQLKNSGIALPHDMTDLSLVKNRMLVHDPSVIKDGDWYYMYNTDIGDMGEGYRAGIHVRRSRDLVNWEWCGYALDGIPKAAAKHVRKPGGIWAPDISKIDGMFYLYYCVSVFGTNNSYIGAAKSASPLGPWEDLGEILTTDDGDAPNALDPNIIIDKHGKMYMCYGSFFSGIYICELDRKTGLRKDKGSFGIKIAQRNKNAHFGGIEGPYIVYNEKFDKYYLFSSYDDLAKTYNIRVAWADEVTGPYYDANGIEMTNTEYTPYDSVGLKITNGYHFDGETAWIGPGHNSVLRDGDDWFVISHARDTSKKNTPCVHVRKIVWTENGFPIVSPEQYMGETEQNIPEPLICGKWNVIVLSCDTNTVIPSEPLDLFADGTTSENEKWSYDGKNRLDFVYKGKQCICRVLPAYNRDKNSPTLVFTGIDEDNICVWGKHII